MSASATKEIKIWAGQKIEIPSDLMLVDIPSTNKDQRIFRILTEDKGDERLVWSVRNLAQINAAKEMFTRLLSRGMRAFAVDEKGRKNVELREFDPSAGEVIFCPIPAVVGG